MLILGLFLHITSHIWVLEDWKLDFRVLTFWSVLKGNKPWAASRKQGAQAPSPFLGCLTASQLLTSGQATPFLHLIIPVSGCKRLALQLWYISAIKRSIGYRTYFIPVNQCKVAAAQPGTWAYCYSSLLYILHWFTIKYCIDIQIILPLVDMSNFC